MEIWGYQLPLLRSRFRVLLYDIRGHGRSAAPGNDYTLEALAADVANLLDYLGIPRVAFVGLSIGGTIAQAFALNYPERISALVLCSTGSETGAQAKLNIEQRIKAVLAEGMGTQVEAAIRRWFGSDFITAAPATVAWVSDLIRSTLIGGFVGCCRALQGLSLTDRLGQIRAKTLLIPGELDQGFPPSVSQVIHQQIAGSELKVLPGAAHLGNVERAHAFNEILVEFLERVCDG
jgi:3-oxoadipate enol-lactonase